MVSSHVVITGGEGHLGQSIASAMDSSCVRVSAPGKAELDVTSSDSVSSYFSQLDGLDLLVCNAGSVDDSLLVNMKESQWDDVMKVNLTGSFHCAREASKLMMKSRRGHIIFISSFSALQPAAGQASYAAAKASLLGLTKSLAQELGSRNIRVNTILPGFLETKMTNGLSAKAKESSLSKHTLGRLNTPAAVADFVTFLHHSMPHTSGQVFNLDSRILP